MILTPTSSSTVTAIGSLQVLIIDDDPFMHELVGSMLRQIGVSRVTSALDGDQGIAALAKITPDVIICDLNMPGKDGFQVMEALAAGSFAGGVVLLSGLESRVLNSAALMGRFHHLNVLGVVNKPVSKPALAGLLQNLVYARA